jgi:hypothetical protein
MEYINNPELQMAFDFVQFTNRNVFLTGKAGTGKTTFLHHLKSKSPKRMVVVAPTGVAAINAGGVTIHSFFQLPFHPFIPAQYITDTGQKTEPLLSSSFKLGREKINIIKSLDLLIIDEISMVRSDLLDAIDMVLRRHKDRNRPFGGVQLLMIGDIHQLSPVVKDEDWEMLSRYYETAFFFGSLALRSSDYVTIELKFIFRQQDRMFIELLNKIRDSKMDNQSLDILNKRCDPQFHTGEHEGYITLTTHNNQAQKINDSKLEKLPGKARIFKASIRDEFPEYAYPTAEELLLKTGAQVMFVKNDISKDKLYFNGKIGRITGFDDDLIMVHCPADDTTIAVTEVEWQNMKYALDEDTKEIQETVIGSFIQYPLKLAWAITIHKSQGLTFDRVVIDAHAAFAHGQVYVALSRCRTLEGMVLSTPISNRSIISDATVSEFARLSEQNQPGTQQLVESKKTYEQFLLSELFDFDPWLRLFYSMRKLTQENKDALLEPQTTSIEAWINHIKLEMILVSEKFKPQISYLLASNPDIATNELLQERIGKACRYFLDKLSVISGNILAVTVQTDNKAVKKPVTESLNRIKQELTVKQQCLEAMMQGFGIREYLEAKARAVLSLPVLKTKNTPSVEDTSGKIQHRLLMDILRDWRDRKAKESGVPHYMILHQNTLATLVNYLPRTMESLKQIKGMGKKKPEQYGAELLAIIDDFCMENHLDSVPIVHTTHRATPAPKADTKLVTLNMYKEGKTIQQIVQERAMAVTTIEGHIAYYIGTGEIPVMEFVSAETAELITRQFMETGNHQLKPVKESLGDQVSWVEIKFVLKHLEYTGQMKIEKDVD